MQVFDTVFGLKPAKHLCGVAALLKSGSIRPHLWIKLGLVRFHPQPARTNAANAAHERGLRGISLAIGIAITLPLLSPAVLAADNVLTGDVRVTVHPDNIRESLPVPGASKRVFMSLHGVDVRDVLRALAREGGFNVLLDESVEGTISVDLHNVTIQDALETVKTYANLAYSIQGRSLAAASATSPKGQAFQKSVTRIFPLRNANASTVATFLNNTVFADRTGASGGASGGSATSATGGTGGTASSSVAPVTADYHTNSLIVVGSPTDIRTVEKHIEALDQPRHMRTWRLSHANALDVATMLSSSLFNEGQPAVITTGSGGSSSSSSSGGSQSSGTPSALRVTAENIAEGSGASQAGQGGGSSGGSSSGSSSTAINNLTLRGRVQQTQTVQLSPGGPIIMPDTRLNAITLLGTAEQIAMAEAMMPTLDRKIPQVVLEASLVEVTEDGRKELGFSSGGNSRKLSFGSNNSGSSTLINRAFSNTIGRTNSSSTPLESVFRFTTNSLRGNNDFVYQLNALVSRNKAKILANPTVVTTSDNEALISIVDEIIRSITVTQGSVNNTQNFTTNIGDAGIILNILPKVGADGSLSLRIRPVVSSVARTEADRFGNVVTLLSKRETLAQNVQLKDGETFVLGGLLHDTNTDAIARNPVLSSLPIVGALGRNTANSRHRSELVIMITPHIVQDDEANLIGGMPHVGPPASTEAGIHPAALLQGAHPTASGHGRKDALPPLDKPHIIGGETSQIAPTEAASSLYKAMPRVLEQAPASRASASQPPAFKEPDRQSSTGITRVFSRKPKTSGPEVQVRLESAPKPASQPSQSAEPTPASSPASRTTDAPNGPVSDETIRTILEKFKPEQP